jgi:Ca2+-binding RTX toxin-like protein
VPRNVFFASANGAVDGSEDDDLIYGFNPEGAGSDVGSIAATLVAAGLSQPLFAGAPPADLGRLFIVEKTGQIKILDLTSQQVLPTPFLNVSGQILTDGERGLLGLAFHPDFAQNGFFYVNLINTSGDTEIRRYQVSATDRNQADPATGTLVITVDQPDLSNHKAGWLDFGPDGYLYVALGDGGGAGDPSNNAQNLNSLLGKMLRLDVGADAFPGDAMRNYAIPPDNPFVGVAGADEIWALGLRNPWRAGFDRAHGDLYIGDVGQNRWEEVDLGQAGANYGWKIFEGPEQFSAGTPSGGTLTAPMYYYGHNGGGGASIVGGYVYRGTSDGLQGDYFFADTVTGQIFTLDHSSGTWAAVDRTSQIHTDTGSITTPVSFGEDGAGNLYVVDLDGSVYRLTPGAAFAQQPNQLRGMGGHDMLFGGSGDDTHVGGTGNDELQGGQGNDTMDGGDGADTLIGGSGLDTLLAGSGLWTDVLGGGAGDDTYELYNVASPVFENAGEGWDTVRSYAWVTVLWDNVEDLQLVDPGNNTDGSGNALGNILRGNIGRNRLNGLDGNDTVIGNAGDDTMDGGNGADTLNGGDGNDTLYAGSGLWTDVLVGAVGDDIYELYNVASQVYENAGEGWDTVRSYAWVTVLWDNVEDLQLIDPSSNTDGIGNALGNILRGNIGSNHLSGVDGNDILIGNAGNDTLDGANGSDTLNGGDGNDTLYAGSGLWTDVLVGAAGDDIYELYNVASQLYENAGDGIDTLRSYAWATTLPANVENLVLVDPVSNVDGTGNVLNNSLTGNAGSNILNGLQGADTLTGGAGQDTFVLRPGDGGSALSLADVIADYQDGADSIGLGGGLTYAGLTIQQGTGANTNHTIIQRTATGEYLAVLQNVNAQVLDALDFKTISG